MLGSDELCSNCGFFTGILYILVFIAMTLSADMTVTCTTVHTVESILFLSKRIVLLHPGVLGTNYSFPTSASGEYKFFFYFSSAYLSSQPLWEVECLCV